VRVSTSFNVKECLFSFESGGSVHLRVETLLDVCRVQPIPCGVTFYVYESRTMFLHVSHELYNTHALLHP